jgi:hypothetical protein
MQYTDILSSYFENRNSSKDLVFKFFITFARFECALKNSKTFAIMQGKNCIADWNGFVNTISEFNSSANPELKTACTYILDNPPKKQNIINKTLKWKDCKIDGGTEIQKLNQYIRRIRNNLFHGGKFNNDNIPELSRNSILMTSALVILNNWLELHQEVRGLFLAEIYDGE